MEDRKKILIVDFMYLWNRVRAVKGTHAGSHIYASLQHVDSSDYYFQKYIVLDGVNSSEYRRKWLPDYKEGRSDKSESYSDMEKFLLNNAVNFKTLKFIKNDTYEADDVIAAFVKKYDKADKFIYSGDTDLYQLLRFDNTYIGTTYSRGMVITPVSKEEANKRYTKKYGINIKDSHYITKCKTFKGDTSDNIPIACPGMRTSTINTLLENFWDNDEPLSSTILLNMANYLKENGKQSEFHNFFDNRKAIIRNYKLVQLGYSDPDVFTNAKTLQESGIWE